MGGMATSPLRSRGSPNKGTKSKVPHKWAEFLHHPCVVEGPQTRGQSQRCPTSGQNCYITPAFSGVPKQGDKVKGAPQVGRISTSPLRSRGSPNKGTKSKVAHKWAEFLHHPCVLGGPQTRGQSQRWPTSGQNSYITPTYGRVPKQGDKVKGGPQGGGIATSPLRLGGPQTRTQSQRWPTGGRNGYITPAFSGVPKQGDKVKGAPQVGGIPTSPLRSRGSPNKGTKSKVPDKWAEFLHHPCVLGGPQTRGQSQRWPTSGRNGYITPAFSGVPKQRDKVKGAPQVGGTPTSPLRCRGSPNKGTKSKVPHKWAELLHHPCVLGGPQTRGQSQRCPISGQNCYITRAFSGVPKQGDKVKGAPQVGRIATSPLRSRGSPNKGTKSKVPHKWAEFLHHPCVLGGPQTRGQSQRWPTSGRNSYITPAFSAVPKQGDKVKGARQVGRIATSPLRSWGSPNKGTKSKVPHKWAELLYHPCVLGGPQTRGQSQRWPTSGQNCYITPAFSGVPKQGDKVKGAQQVGTIATSPLRSRGSPNKGTKSKVAHKWARLLHHPCVLGGPQTRVQSQRWPTSGQNCYITPAFSGVPKQGDKVKGAPQVGRISTSPLRSRGSPNKGTKAKVPDKWAELLHHPCVLEGPQTRGQSERWPTSGRNCYITLASPRSANKDTKSKVAHRWAELLHHPCVLGGPQTRGQSQRCPTSGRNSYITPALSRVPKQGDKVKGARQVGRIPTSPLCSWGSPNKGTKSKVPHKWAELLHHPCVLGGPQTRGQSQRCPTSGRNCYITLASRRSPNKDTKSKVPHKWAEFLHHPCVLGGPQTREQSQRWTTSGQNCYITPAFSGVPKQGDKVKGGPQVGGIATSPLRLGGPQTRTQSQGCPTSGRNGYITPAFSGVPKQGDKVKGPPQVGRIATSPLRCRGSPNKDTKSKVAHNWAELLHHPCVLGGPQTRGQSQRPRQVDRIATSPLCSWGSPNKGTKSKVAHKWAELLHHTCVFGGPQTRGQSQRWPTSGRNCYITLASRRSPNKDTKSKVPHKWAEWLHNPCVLGGPQTRGQSQRSPTSGRNCYITPALSGVPKQGDKVKGGPQVGGIPTDPLRSRGSPNKGTKSKVPNKWAELLHHPCVLGGPQTSRQSQRWPTSGQNCYITPAFLGVPKQGDKVKGAPQVGRIATSPLRSRGSPNKGTKSKVPHKWAQVVHHPCVLGGPQTKGQSQRWPTSGHDCYITPAFLGVPKQGYKVKGGPQVGRICTSPLRLGGPQTRGQSQTWPRSGRNCYITPAFLGVPKQGDKVKGAP